MYLSALSRFLIGHAYYYILFIVIVVTFNLITFRHIYFWLQFLRGLSTVTGKDVKTFIEQWVYPWQCSLVWLLYCFYTAAYNTVAIQLIAKMTLTNIRQQSGCAHFHGNFIFNRKRNVVELELKQDMSARGARRYVVCIMSSLFFNMVFSIW